MPYRLFYILILLLCVQFPSFGQETSILFSPAKNLPYFESPEVSLDSAEYNTIILRAKANQKGFARLFWASSYDMQFNPPKSIWFSIKSGEHSYYINIPSQNSYWIGWIKKFILYPETRLEIQSAKIIRGNLFSHLASGWQEFWGPRGRLVIGSTINTMQSSNLFGRSIFFYIYWITGIILMGFVLWEIKNILPHKKKPAFNEFLLKIGKAAFLLIIIFWIMVELNTLSNNWQYLKEDSKLLGKSLDEKRTIVNPGDFYSFILFCKEHLPAGARFDYRMLPIYGDIKARYYLYPREHEKEAKFLLVYDREVVKELDKYEMWKKFREGAFILRRK
jgi:hypothetical protein